MSLIATYLFLIIFVLFSISGCAAKKSELQPQAQTTSQEALTTSEENQLKQEVPNDNKGLNEESSLEERWGIKILAIRQSAAGYMLDFRYRVIDPEKASPLFSRQIKPYLIDQASGTKFVVPNPPKTGPLRTSDPPKANRNYFIFFANPGKFVKVGNKVTVVIGELKAEDLVVE